MSNYLAIATVTAGLVQVLQQSIDNDVPGATVTMARPDANGRGMPTTGVNLYLFQVTPNAAWRNTDLPTRDSDGRPVQRPRVALDLHYLLTFYGDETRFEPQRVLGSVVRTLHERPLLTRQVIQDAINANPPDVLGASNLADEVELVKFTPIALSLEEMSKLWSVFFQIPYTLSVAYQGTVVLIEGEETPRSTLPVRKPMVKVMPFRQPVIEEVTPQSGPNAPIVMGDTLIIRGRNLRGDITRVRIAGMDVDPQEMSNTQVSLTLAAPPLLHDQLDGLRAGVQGVQVVHWLELGEPPTPHHGFESGIAPFVLHPKFSQPPQLTNIQNTGPNIRSADVTLTVEPRIGKRQRAVLLLNEFKAKPPPGYVLAQYTFEARRRADFEFTSQAFDDLKDAGVPGPVLAGLQTLKDKEFTTERAFLEDVRAVIGDAQTEQFRDLLLKYAGPQAGIKTMTIHASNVKATDYLVRIQVDGAESSLMVDDNPASETFNRFIGPKVPIP